MSEQEYKDKDKEEHQDKEKEHEHGKPLKVGRVRKVLATILLLPFFPVAWFFRQKKIDEVTCYSANEGFFCWLIILSGFVFTGILNIFPDLAGVLGWVYLWIWLFFFISLAYDISAKVFLLWVVVFSAIWFGLRHVEHLQNVVILGAITQHFADLNPQFDKGTACVVSWLLLLPFSYAIFHLFANGRKTFSPNEISEFHFLDGNEMSDRIGLRFRTKYRDLLETILAFGGGDIIAFDNHKVEIKRYPNILFLYFIWPRLEKVLNQRSVVEED